MRLQKNDLSKNNLQKNNRGDSPLSDTRKFSLLTQIPVLIQTSNPTELLQDK